MTHGFVSVCQDQGVLVRREERGAAEVPSFRLLRGVLYSVRARAVKIVRGAPLLMEVVTARSLQLSELCSSAKRLLSQHRKHLPE